MSPLCPPSGGASVNLERVVGEAGWMVRACVCVCACVCRRLCFCMQLCICAFVPIPGYVPAHKSKVLQKMKREKSGSWDTVRHTIRPQKFLLSQKKWLKIQFGRTHSRTGSRIHFLRRSQDGSIGSLWTHLLPQTEPIYNYSWKSYPWDRTENWIRGTPATRETPNWGRRGRNTLLERKNTAFTSHRASRLPWSSPYVHSPPQRSRDLSRGAPPL